MRAWSSHPVRAATALAAAAVCLGIAGCGSQPLTNLERLTEARRLSAAMLVEFTKAADAGNRAVMADTDEASTAFAREAEAAADRVEKDRTGLETLLRELSFAEESRLLGEFTTRFADYRTLERSILDLAVENTNLKAQRLSFGPMRDAVDGFREALQAVVAGTTGADSWRVRALAAEALADVRQIQVLQAPHIAESDDAAMTKLEERAAAAEKAARQAVKDLAGHVKPSATPQLAKAGEALDRAWSVNAEIVTLSRRNSNVRSLALALGQKRTRTAACEESLRALQEALTKRGFKATK